MILMPLLYLPPLSYMALLHAAGDVCIEAQENYIKSTYRNRCEILGSNGLIDLSIPLCGGRDHHHAYRDSQIDYTSDWQHRHRMSIISCYGSAPFFEHYMPYFEKFYDRQYANLFDYNKELLQLLLRSMKLNVNITFSEIYEKEPIGKTDLRKAFKPGKAFSEIQVGQDTWLLKEVLYMRVFDTDVSLLSLSALDLLFNEGPHSKNILQQMVLRP